MKIKTSNIDPAFCDYFISDREYLVIRELNVHGIKLCEILDGNGKLTPVIIDEVSTHTNTVWKVV